MDPFVSTWMKEKDDLSEFQKYVLDKVVTTAEAEAEDGIVLILITSCTAI